jgi:hypothetical protein
LTRPLALVPPGPKGYRALPMGPQARPFVPHVVVAADSLRSDDPDAVVGASIQFVNRLRAEALLELEELSRDALMSYYVDYYAVQVANGGFSQFVWNTCWDGLLVGLVRDGLAAMGARRQAAAFEAGAAIVARLGPGRLAVFVEGEYFGSPNPEREALAAADDAIRDASREEDLTTLNDRWLRGLPDLVAEDDAGLRRLVERVAASVPDRAERRARARSEEPDYLKVVKALCARAGHAFDQVTAGDPAFEYDGVRTVGWHFWTDRGHFVAVGPAAGGAVMLDAESRAPVAELSPAAVEELVGAGA